MWTDLCERQLALPAIIRSKSCARNVIRVGKKTLREETESMAASKCSRAAQWHEQKPSVRSKQSLATPFGKRASNASEVSRAENSILDA